MIRYNFPKPNKKLLSIEGKNYIKGLNTLVSATQIRNDELSEAIDIQLIEDGKVQVPRDGQSYFGNSNGSKVTGIFPFYKSDGTRQLLRTCGTKLQVYNSTTGDFDDVTGKDFTTTLNTEAIMAYDKLYLCNGIDNLCYYDGTNVVTWTGISAPTSPTCTRTGGGTGSFTFSYKITAVTAIGETEPTAAATATLNQATLSPTVYMTVGWTASTSAIGYNIYGRKDGSWYFLKYVEGQATNSYVDTGVDTPYEILIPPLANYTAGVKGKYIQVYKESLFVFGDPAYPSRLYYSGGGDKINDFSAANGGGFIDISNNDGQYGTGMIPFKNSLVVFKDNSIYQFSFTTSGAPSVTQITAAVGAKSSRSIVLVENDIFFASNNGVYTIGNESGFAIDVLRTNELSARVRSIFQSMAPSRTGNVAAIYAKTANLNLVIFAYTPAGGTYNSKALIYDRERIAWYEWTNIQANCWTNFIGSDGVQHILYGDDNSGYVKEILSGSSDFGTAISGKVKLKSFSYDSLTTYKTAKDVSVVLRQPVGSVNLSVIVDGVKSEYSSNINTVSPSINLGHYLMGYWMPGVSYGTGSVTSSDDIVLKTKKNLNLLGKSFGLSLNNGSSGARFVLLEHSQTAKPRNARYRKSEDLVN
jgi:hypothetical protein